MANLIKTETKNLYTYLNSKGLKVFVAIIFKDKQKYQKTLGAIKLVKAKKDLKNYRLEIESQLNEFTFNDVFFEYINIVRRLQTEKEIKTKLSINSNHLKLISNMNIEHIKYTDCQKIINSALDKGLKPKTAKNIKAVIQVVFNFAIKQQYTDTNPATLVQIPKFDNKQYLKISTTQAKELHKNVLLCENEVIRDIIILGFHGRRLSECLKLQWFQVNLDDKYYTLPYQKNKSKKHLEFSMTNELYTMFLKRYAFATDTNQNEPDDYVFINPRTSTKFSSITKTFNNIKVASGINPKDFRFHDFRHLLGTYAINELKQTIEHVSHTLGHSGIEVTQVYITKNKNTSKKVCDSYLSFLNEDNTKVLNNV